jgi:hypothetical protein
MGYCKSDLDLDSLLVFRFVTYYVIILDPLLVFNLLLVSGAQIEVEVISHLLSRPELDSVT